MKKTISLLLALILLLSALPLAGAAAEVKIEGYESVTHVEQGVNGPYVSTYVFSDGSKIVAQDGKVTYSDVAGISKEDIIIKATGGQEFWSPAHRHEFEWIVNRDGHFYRCTCGAKHHFAEHTIGTDGRCICGYKFMDNADLTVLWMRGIKLSPSFKKDVTEYEGQLLVKDLKETQISAFSFDAKATVELPEDLTLKTGKNVFQIKITAEDGKATKTYTVTVNKE